MLNGIHTEATESTENDSEERPFPEGTAAHGSPRSPWTFPGRAPAVLRRLRELRVKDVDV
jgi:hypothetical protein